MDLLSHLLPLDARLGVDGLTFDTEAHRLTIELQAIAPRCLCPSCFMLAERIHSHYSRTVADLPWADLVVRLHLRVRKFFCDNRACVRQIFTERLPALVAPSARRTRRLTQQQQQIGLALGGNASARVSTVIGQGASRNTFLRLIRQLPLPDPVAPVIIGVDDWAWLKGQRYGTIIVDLERHQPIALLADREVATLTAWLRQHPNIQIIARDRAGVYAEAATTGAPQAMQVADRFHLLKNLADTLLAVFEQHAQALRAVTSTSDTVTIQSSSGEPTAEAMMDVVHRLPPPTPSPKHQAQAEQRRAARLAQYGHARQLYAQGWPLRAIGRELRLNRNTVRSYVRATSFPERQPRILRQPGVLDPFIPYLIEQWNAGCRNGTVLWKDISARGYSGKRVTVFSFVTRLRKALGIPAKNRTIRTGKVALPDERPLTPRTAVWQVLQRPDTADETTTERIATLRQLHPDLDAAITLTQGFARLIRARDPTALDPWLDQAASSTLAAFRGFAASLRRDYNAVRAGVTVRWSTGPVEGAINRLKMIKRTMFGRAGFPLLQRRVLLGR